MKVSKEQLRALIKEELDAVMKEAGMLEEAKPPMPGQGEDGSDSLDYVTRDQPKQGVVGKVKDALGLGQKQPLTKTAVNRAYGEKPSSGKFKSVGNAYGDENNQDLAVRDRTAADAKKLNITRFKAMEEGSESEKAHISTAPLDRLVGQELPLFGVIESDRTFKLGDQVFKAIEELRDLSSVLGAFVVVPEERNAKRNKFSAEPLATVRVEKVEEHDDYSTGGFDGYALVDVETGHKWLKVGTAAPDDIYPGFEFEAKAPKGVSSYGSDIEGIKSQETSKALDMASDEFDVIRKGQIAAARKAGKKVTPVDRNKEIDKLVKEAFADDEVENFPADPEGPSNKPSFGKGGMKDYGVGADYDLGAAAKATGGDEEIKHGKDDTSSHALDVLVGKTLPFHGLSVNGKSGGTSFMKPVGQGDTLTFALGNTVYKAQVQSDYGQDWVEGIRQAGRLNAKGKQPEAMVKVEKGTFGNFEGFKLVDESGEAVALIGTDNTHEDQPEVLFTKDAEKIDNVLKGKSRRDPDAEDLEMEQIAESFRRFTKILKG